MDMITRESPWVSFRRLAKTGKTFAISASARIQPPRKIPKNTPQTARKKGPSGILTGKRVTMVPATVPRSDISSYKKM